MMAAVCRGEMFMSGLEFLAYAFVVLLSSAQHERSKQEAAMVAFPVSHLLPLNAAFIKFCCAAGHNVAQVINPSQGLLEKAANRGAF